MNALGAFVAFLAALICGTIFRRAVRVGRRDVDGLSGGRQAGFPQPPHGRPAQIQRPLFPPEEQPRATAIETFHELYLLEIDDDRAPEPAERWIRQIGLELAEQAAHQAILVAADGYAG